MRLVISEISTSGFVFSFSSFFSAFLGYDLASVSFFVPAEANSSANLSCGALGYFDSDFLPDFSSGFLDFSSGFLIFSSDFLFPTGVAALVVLTSFFLLDEDFASFFLLPAGV